MLMTPNTDVPDDRRAARRALEHADEDRWEECLAVLRTDVRHPDSSSSTHRRLALHQVRTDGGDRLVHLCAFATGETSLPLSDRRTALTCLELVLTWSGLRASQARADDGGTALHALLAAASSSGEEEEEAGELTLSAVTLLLEAGSDPNAALLNVLSDLDNLNDDDDDDEPELSYAREAVVQLWTPLVMVVVWSSLRRKSELPLSVLERLLAQGADPSYTVGGNLQHGSTPLEFAALCLVHDRPRWERVQAMLSSTASSPPLSTIQSFVLAVLHNDSDTVRANTWWRSDTEDSGRLLIVSDHFPLPAMVFRAADTYWAGKTLLELACSFRAWDAVLLLLLNKQDDDDDPPSETLCRNAILSSFAPSPCRDDINSDDSSDDDGNNPSTTSKLDICEKIIETYTNQHHGTDDKVLKRQQFVDKLLLSSCTSSTLSSLSPSPSLLSLLLTHFHADPNVASVLHDQVEGRQTPLHLSAAAGQVDVVRTLLSHPATRRRPRNAAGTTPLEVALRRRRHRVARCLYEDHKDDDDVLSPEDAYRLGVAGIECRDVGLLRDAVGMLVRQQQQQQQQGDDPRRWPWLGRLLSWAVDARSGLGRPGSDDDDDDDTLREAVVDTLLPTDPPFVPDDVSHKTVLHKVLVRDRLRAHEVRTLLLRPLCAYLTRLEVPTNTLDDNGLISRPCHVNFGQYTALHLACALGCEASIRTLLEYGADVDALDGEGKKPWELLENRNYSLSLRKREHGSRQSYAFRFNL